MWSLLRSNGSDMSVGPYEIQTGDNLSHIATSAGMNEEELEAANPDRPIKTWWRRPILWNEAGAIVWIEGYSNGDGGTGTPGPPGPPGPEGPQGPPGTGGDFDGEHVLTGDPDSPPEGWAAGQMLLVMLAHTTTTIYHWLAAR
jgi:hypothetical protein